ncbi:hypothetical protein [Mycobacterium sp.]|uniref:hypothetical protein n=1 Tax=Mycobacterium sp. TaxID=1785 RepID=UPI003C769953
MLFRATLVVVSIVTAAIGSASLAGADPHCAAGQCGPAPGQTPSYQDGYNTEHAFYSQPRNGNFLKNEMQQAGYNAGMVCQLEMGGGPLPPNQNDWIRGCVDALHDLGFKP